jgi:prophage regulatory protein
MHILNMSVETDKQKQETRSPSMPPPETPHGARRLLPLPAVQAEVGLHKTTIYGLIRDGKFPRPIKIGDSSRWLSDELEAWIDELAASR